MPPGVIGQLAVAQMLVWAGGFYAFPALLPTWQNELGWSKTTLTSAFTLALLIAAAASPVAGRLIDRGHGRLMLATASAGLALGLLVLSTVTQAWQFVAVWAGIGLCLAGALYDPCFAFIVHRFPKDARRAITRTTMLAGLSGTLAFPMAAWTTAAFGWRASLVVFALLILTLAVPLLWRLGPGTGRARLSAREAAARPAVARRRGSRFWLLMLAFAAMALTQGMVITHLLPLLDAHGASPQTAIFAAACLGPMQVVGRLAVTAVERRWAIGSIGLGVLAVVFAGLVVLGLAATNPAWIALFIVLHGAGYGVYAIVRPVLTAEVLGRRDFGAVHGALSTAAIVATALAPMIAARLWQAGGSDLVLISALAAVVVAFAAMAAAARYGKRQ